MTGRLTCENFQQEHDSERKVKKIETLLELLRHVEVEIELCNMSCTLFMLYEIYVRYDVTSSMKCTCSVYHELYL